MKQDLRPRNDKSQKHGIWKIYHDNGNLGSSGQYINGKRHGFFEGYYFTGRLSYKGYRFNDFEYGYWTTFQKNIFFLK